MSNGGTSGTGGANPTVYHVPWKIADPAKEPAAGLILWWFPASENEIKNSSLKESRDLSLYAGQCVAMQVADVRYPKASVLLGESKLPVAVLATPEGAVVSKLENKDGKLKVADVEKMVGGEIKQRENSIEASMKDAKTKSASGAKDEAIKLLQSVLSQKCMFPKKAKDAVKELKKPWC